MTTESPLKDKMILAVDDEPDVLCVRSSPKQGMRTP
jgi:hypothetical protein